MRPKLGEGIRGIGRPAWVETFGKWREFHDGGVLCSTGRWPPDQRNSATGEDRGDLGAQLKPLTWRVVGGRNPQKFLATLACGKVKTSPFTMAQIAEERNLFGSWLKSHHEEHTLAVREGRRHGRRRTHSNGQMVLCRRFRSFRRQGLLLGVCEGECPMGFQARL